MTYHYTSPTISQLILACLFVLMRPSVYYDRRKNMIVLSDIFCDYYLLKVKVNMIGNAWNHAKVIYIYKHIYIYILHLLACRYLHAYVNIA